MNRIRVTIDRVILGGFEPGDQKALVGALQRELSQVLSDSSTRAQLAHSRRTPVLQLGRMPLESGSAGSRILGRAVARAIGRGLKP